MPESDAVGKDTGTRFRSTIDAFFYLLLVVDNTYVPFADLWDSVN